MLRHYAGKNSSAMLPPMSSATTSVRPSAMRRTAAMTARRRVAAAPVAGLVLEVEAIIHGATGAGGKHRTGADLEHATPTGAGEGESRRQQQRSEEECRDAGAAPATRAGFGQAMQHWFVLVMSQRGTEGAATSTLELRPGRVDREAVRQ